MRCSQCNAELENEAAAFCSYCGSKVPSRPAQPVEPRAAGPLAEGPASAAPPAADPLEDSETLTHDDGLCRQEYRQVLQIALADGLLDGRDRQALDKARHELRLSEAEAAGLEQEALGMHCPPADEHASQSAPLRLEINDNHFYMEKRAGVLDFRLRSAAVRSECRFLLRLEGNFLGSHEWKGNLSAGQTARRKFQVVPGIGGEHLVDLTLEVEQDEEPGVWTAQPTLKVLLPDENPTNMTVVFDQRMESGRNIGYGLSIRNEVKEGFAKGVLRDVNDLLRGRFEDHWQPLWLSADEERTAQLRRSRPKRIRVVRRATAGAAVDRLTLSPDDAAAPTCVLLAKAQVTIGRKREGNDIVVRKLPRSPANDMVTLQLSGSHVRLTMTEHGLVLKDLGTVNGTTLNGLAVKGETVVPLDRPSELDLAKAFRLRIVPFLDSSPAVGIDRYADLGRPDDLWRTAEKLRLRSVLIESADESVVIARHLLVLRWIEAGCRPGNEIALPGPCNSRHCMRVLRLGGRFWLEALTEDDCLNLGGEAMPAGHAAELVPATAICCTHSSWKVLSAGLGSPNASPPRSRPSADGGPEGRP